MTEWIGFAAAAGTTLAFLPQLIRVWKTRSAEDISLIMYLVLVIGVALWIVYGLRIRSLPVVVANSATLLLASGVLAAKLRFRRNCS
jgi:MtN3 and saliva related transmembrane protein